MVTDEDDYSTVTPSSFTSWFKGLKTDPSKVSFSAICGDPGLGCSDFTSWNSGIISASAGTKYLKVKDATNGVWQSICTSDFGNVLDYLSLNVSGMTDTFELAQKPSNIAQMTVEVDGVPATYSGVNGYTYSSQDNAIVFHGTEIPGPGSRISVSYPYASVCN